MTTKKKPEVQPEKVITPDEVIAGPEDKTEAEAIKHQQKEEAEVQPEKPISLTDLIKSKREIDARLDAAVSKAK